MESSEIKNGIILDSTLCEAKLGTRQFRCLHFERSGSNCKAFEASVRDGNGVAFEISAFQDGVVGADGTVGGATRRARRSSGAPAPQPPADGAPSAVGRGAKRPVTGPDVSASGCASAGRGGRR